MRYIQLKHITLRYSVSWKDWNKNLVDWLGTSLVIAKDRGVPNLWHSLYTYT